MRFFFCLLFGLCFSNVFCQVPLDSLPVTASLPKKTVEMPPYDLPNPRNFGSTILASDLRPLVTMLASDSFQGRETGEPGQRMAEQFISQQFKAAGIAPKSDRNDYSQPVIIEKMTWATIGLNVDGTAFKNKIDYYVFPNYISDLPETTIKEAVFLGYGIEDEKYSDYKDADIKGKVVVFYDSEPMDANKNSLITGTEFRSNWSISWRKKVQLAQTKGATMVFIIDPNISENVVKNKKNIGSVGWQPVANMSTEKSALINAVFISPEVAKAIFGKKSEKIDAAVEDLKKGKASKAVKFKTKITVQFDKEFDVLKGANVMAVIEGSDPILKKEYVLVTAHYDHLGMSDTSRIFHGADDNASGTAGVIEIAQAFHEAQKQGVGPKRTVVCMLVSGEEKGLLGSKYYVEFPLFPLDKTVVDINIDMIGRVDDLHKDGKYVYSIGSDRLSSELITIVERNNYYYAHLDLDYKYDDLKDPNRYYERSDHYNFALKGIPAVFLFNGTHKDYHQVTDTVDKIDFDALQQRARLAFYTAWEIANRPSPLSVDKKK